MIDFREIITYSKKLSSSFLKGKAIDDEVQWHGLEKKDTEDILNTLHDEGFWVKRKSFIKAIETDEEWKKLEKNLRVSKPKSRNFQYWKYAAAAVLLIGFSLGIFYNTAQVDSAQDTIQSSHTLVAGSDKAILSLENGDEVQLSEKTAYTSPKARLTNNQLLYTKSAEASELRFNSLTIPRGGKFMVTLSDGTKIWLNSESKLTYPVQFIPGQPRSVELVYGEAYFEVSPSTQHHGDSFIVKQNSQELEVLGTEFNISAYTNEAAVYTTLVEGSIALHNTHSSKILKPGEQAVNTGVDSDLIIKKVDVNYATAWKDGVFLFRDATLQAMMHQLSRWYDAEVDFENDEKKTYLFSGTLKREDDIQSLLQNLEKTGEVSFEIKNKKIKIK